jgi:hypothetical protein
MEGEKVEILGLNNICGGALDEVFRRELREVLKNMYDINTPAEATRKITLELTFSPYEDRSGAEVHFTCKSKTVPVKAVSGRVFFARRGTEIVAVPHDPKQPALFPPMTDEEATKALKEVN